MAKSIKQMLEENVASLENEIAAKQEELKLAKENVKKYNDNKDAIEAILALQNQKKPRGRKPKGREVGNGKD